LALSFASRGRGSNTWVPVKQSIKLAWVSCNYGGKRPFFVCPKCERRFFILYSGDREFLCRKCHNLNYASTSEGKLDRMIRKSRKIRRRLEAGPNLSLPVAKKPRGMHWARFLRILDQTSRLENEITLSLWENLSSKKPATP
jgi:hypothetical protein